MISRPGVRIGLGLDAGLQTQTIELARYAAMPLGIALIISVVLTVIMRETYPKTVAK